MNMMNGNIVSPQEICPSAPDDTAFAKIPLAIGTATDAPDFGISRSMILIWGREFHCG
jgi:hypothetical protein